MQDKLVKENIIKLMMIMTILMIHYKKNLKNSKIINFH